MAYETDLLEFSDIFEGSKINCLDNDLKISAHKALKVNRGDCLEFAKKFTWEETARIFYNNISPNSKEINS